jgi:hypothetical protein
VAGVTVTGVRDDKITSWARLYMEPVEQAGSDIAAAVRELYQAPSRQHTDASS